MPSPRSLTRPVHFKIAFESCPVEASWGVLGRRWSLLVLRDIGLFRTQRFNEILRATPGLPKRLLALRLAELEREGFIFRVERRGKYAVWELTEKGRDVLPVLMTLVRFGAKWHADRVFLDGKPRPLTDIFAPDYIRRILDAPPPSIRSRSRSRVRAGMLRLSPPAVVGATA